MSKESQECKTETSKQRVKNKPEIEIQDKIAAKYKANIEPARKGPERPKAFKLSKQAVSKKKQVNTINCMKQQTEEMLEQKRAQTLAKKAERMKQIRAERNAMETPEERQCRLLQNNLVAQSRYRKRLSMQSREQAEEIRAKRAEKHKQSLTRIMISKKQQEGKSQLELEEVKKVCNAQKYKNSRERKQARETPDETAKRRTDFAKYRREKRQQVIALETPEETKARCLKRAEETKRKRKEQQAKETPEQTAERRAKSADRTRRQRAQAKEKLALETPQQKKIRTYPTPEQVEKKRVYAAKLYKKIISTETPEEKIIRNARHADRCRKYRMKQQEKLRSGHGVETSETDRQLTDDTVGDLSASCTWSSFEPSEKSFSIITTTTGGAHSKAETDLLLSAHQPFNKEIVIKNEASQDSWSCFEASESTILTQNIVQDNDWTNEVAAKEKTLSSPTPLIETPVVQAIIVKEEIDL